MQYISLRSHILQIESLPLDRRPELPRPNLAASIVMLLMLLLFLKTSLPPLHTHAVGWRVIVTCRRSLHAVATHNLNSRHAPAHALTGAHSRSVRSPCCCIANRHNALILAVRAAHCFPRNTSPNNARPIPGGKRVLVKRWIAPCPGNRCLALRGRRSHTLKHVS